MENFDFSIFPTKVKFFNFRLKLKKKLWLFENEIPAKNTGSTYSLQHTHHLKCLGLWIVLFMKRLWFPPHKLLVWNIRVQKLDSTFCPFTNNFVLATSKSFNSPKKCFRYYCDPFMVRIKTFVKKKKVLE